MILEKDEIIKTLPLYASEKYQKLIKSLLISKLFGLGRCIKPFFIVLTEGCSKSYQSKKLKRNLEKGISSLLQENQAEPEAQSHKNINT